MTNKSKVACTLYLSWLAIAVFYFYQYILRVVPGVLVTDLRETFLLTAEQFSTLGAFYLYAYALCQIPLGIIVDYIGVRKTVLASVLLCIAGTFLLAYAPNTGLLQLSRVLVGLGSASAFMCALKVVVDNLPAGKRGLLMGATLTMGTVGAFLSGKSVAMMSDHFGWRSTISYVAYLGIVLFFFVFIFLKDTRKDILVPVSKKLMKNIGTSIVEVLKTRSILVYALLAIGTYTPLSVLADLWGVSFLMQKYALTRTQAAETTTMMYLGIALGCLIIPWLSERYHFLNRSIRLCVFGVFSIFALLIYGPALSLLTLKIMLIFMGAFCGAEMLCFTGASYYSTVRNAGTTLGIVNTFNMLGGGLLQQFIGWILDQQWSGAVDANGMRLYDTHQYTMALSVLLLVIFVCCVLSLRLPKDAQQKQLRPVVDDLPSDVVDQKI